MPEATQGPVLRSKRPGQSKEGETNFTERSTINTRSLPKKKNLIPRETTEFLPNISRLLLQAIASCESDNGLSFTELKEVLSAKGYDVRRHCPRIQRKLHLMVSKGALVRMTRSNGSRIFVVGKYQEKTSRIFENPKTNVGAKKARMERRNATRTSAKAKTAAKQAKSSARKMGEASRKLQSPNKKLKRGGRQQRQTTRESSPAKRSQGLVKKAVSATKRSSRSGSQAMPPAKGLLHSNSRAASALMRPRNLRSRVASSEKLNSLSSKVTSKRSRCSNRNATTSAKGLGSPYSTEMVNTRKTRFSRSENTSPDKEQSSKRTAAFPPQKPKSSAVGNTKRQRRR
ncbi:histone H1-like [Rhineura floridana]|uniref:histone H1-like n=1 Tax=Rhineura floridana TaxID=261503 RepID=UPI002AC80B16|nr:histone H1-like [Rhineura floridana]